MKASIIVPLVLALASMVWGYFDERAGYGAGDQVIMAILFGIVAIVQSSAT